MHQQEAANGNQLALTSPPANATPEELALWLADTRTRAHRMIDESVTAAQELLTRRASAIDEGDATAQAQRHAQRLAIERLRRAIGDLTLEVRGVHGRLDRLETLLRTAVQGSPLPEAQAASTVAPIAAAAAALAPATPALTPPSAPAPAPAVVAPTAVIADIVESWHEAPAAVDDQATAPGLQTASLIADAPAAPSTPTEAAPATASVTREIEREIEREPEPREEPVRAEPAAPPAAPTAGFAADARAAVEAAVASALQEARRAASLRSVTTSPADEESSERLESPAEALATPPQPSTETSQEDLRPAASVQASSPPPSAPAPAPEAPRSEARPQEPPVSTPAAPIEPAARPSLWVPPSAIAPRRPEAERDAERETGQEAPRPMSAAAALPPSAVPPGQMSAGAAVATAPAPAAISSAPSAATSPFEGNPAAAAAAAAAVSRFAAATAAATTERLAPGTFGPDGGPIVLRIAPISGFQGLMRVQDAVVQHPPVREATVEAYARGEARLRLQLASPLEAEQLSTALSKSLGLQARIENVSDEERSIQVTLA